MEHQVILEQKILVLPFLKWAVEPPQFQKIRGELYYFIFLIRKNTSKQTKKQQQNQNQAENPVRLIWIFPSPNKALQWRLQPFLERKSTDLYKEARNQFCQYFWEKLSLAHSTVRLIQQKKNTLQKTNKMEPNTFISKLKIGDFTV